MPGDRIRRGWDLPVAADSLFQDFRWNGRHAEAAGHFIAGSVFQFCAVMDSPETA